MPGSEATRLTQLEGLPRPDSQRVAAHNFRRMGQDESSLILITNEIGRHALLEEPEYRRYLGGKIANDELIGKDLLKKGFLRDQLDFKGLSESQAERAFLSWKGPNVHTIVTTLRCNFKCLYCHASVVDLSQTDKDMSLETARATVDLIFQCPSPTLMIEFQGGEPLLNWPTVQFIIQYARKKNEIHKRALHFGLISNFSLLDDEKADFLIANGISFCTSLDGPEALHNKNRIYLGGNSHEQVLAGLGKIAEKKKRGAKVDAPNAICTVTRYSLDYHKEIVDQLISLGFERIQLGPLDPIGFARKSWGKIGYTSHEFVDFYAKTLDYIIELNLRGVKAYEKMALILLIRILEGGHWRFPNADGLCRLAYNYNGDVYTSEEGRLVANEGDEFFKIGNATSSTYDALLDHPTVRGSMLAASANSQPQCFQCAFNPYCTVLPVYNYETQGSLWGHMPSNGWCEKMMGIFDVLFERLQKPAAREVLESWLQYKAR